jgi:hypothetical protein
MCAMCAFVTSGEPQITLGAERAFTYDYVYDVHAQQSSVYNSCVRVLVDGLFDGYNATVLAYGQVRVQINHSGERVCADGQRQDTHNGHRLWRIWRHRGSGHYTARC